MKKKTTNKRKQNDKEYKEFKERLLDKDFAEAFKELSTLNGKSYFIPEGFKVKIKVDRFKARPDYLTGYTEEFRNFIESNEDEIFTVVYDKSTDIRPTLVCLAEDPHPIKFLFWVGDLKVL